MQNYIILNSDGTCGFFHKGVQNNIPETAIEISQEDYERLLDARCHGKLIYVDNANVFQTRDANTILVNDEWVEDTEAIAEQARTQLVSQAKTLLNQSILLDAPIFQNQMTQEQKDDLTAWQEALYGVIYNGDTEMPETPEHVTTFLL